VAEHTHNILTMPLRFLETHTIACTMCAPHSGCCETEEAREAAAAHVRALALSANGRCCNGEGGDAVNGDDMTDMGEMSVSHVSAQDLRRIASTRPMLKETPERATADGSAAVPVLAAADGPATFSAPVVALSVGVPPVRAMREESSADLCAISATGTAPSTPCRASTCCVDDGIVTSACKEADVLAPAPPTGGDTGFASTGHVSLRVGGTDSGS
jgi:hypothetical protein